jgi:hypothetical protein
MTLQINACCSGPFSGLVEEDESIHKNTGETDEEVWDTCLAFDDDLDSISTTRMTMSL